MIRGLGMSAETITDKWEANRVEASKRGAYMHLLCELHLNGATVPLDQPEMILLMKFLATLDGSALI